MIICKCNEITLEEIKDFLKEDSITNLETKLQIGSGCGSCKCIIPLIPDLLNKDQYDGECHED